MSIELDIYTDDEDLNRLCEAYWDVDENEKYTQSLSEISKEFGISSTKLSSIVGQYCTACSDKLKCMYCDSCFVLESRSSLTNMGYIESWTCSECKAELLRVQEESKQKMINDSYQTGMLNPVSLDLLSLRHKVFLMALIKFCASEDLSIILPFSSNPTDYFTPDEDYDFSILRELYKARVIVISPQTDLRHISANEDGFSFSIDRVAWEIPLANGINMNEFYFMLDSDISSNDFMVNREAEIINLVVEIGKIECLAFLEEKMDEHNLKSPAGEKTKAVMAKALESFSVSQMYNFIWRAAKDAAAFYVRNRVNHVHAANTVVANIEKQVERALVNDWKITSYRRNYKKPQSMVSRVLFNLILKTDDGGFHLKLDELLVKIRK